MLAAIEALYRLLTAASLRRFLFDREYRRTAMQVDPLRVVLAILAQVIAWSVVLTAVAIVGFSLWNDVSSR
jgi:hypothetical protein